MKEYKGWTHNERMKSLRLTKKAIVANEIEEAHVCDLCGSTGDDVAYHNEDYSNPTKELRSLCKRCHILLHCRDNNPELWARYVEDTIVLIMPKLTNVPAFFRGFGRKSYLGDTDKKPIPTMRRRLPEVQRWLDTIDVLGWKTVITECTSIAEVACFANAAAREHVAIKPTKTPTRWFKISLANGEMIGTAGLMEKATGGARIKGVYILPEYRGYGYGDRLTAHLIETAVNAGCGTIEAYALHPRWYEEHGFTTHGKTRFGATIVKNIISP